MIGILSYLKQRCQEDWLIGYDSHQFYQITEEFCRYCQSSSARSKSYQILLVEPDPWKFLAFFLGAIAADFSVFLGNTQWQQQEWEQLEQLLNLGGNYGQTIVLPATPSNSLVPSPAILIPTGGSSGKIRFAIHTWETLSNSVNGVQQYFSISQINSFCVLPLHHVAGLMQFLRSFLTGGKLVILPYKSLKQGERGAICFEDFFLSVVPTQLEFLLESAPNWLSQFQTVMLGGAAVSPSLLTAARKQRIRLAATYGMTETASQIATLKPDDFLKGYSNSGQVLPHAKIKIIGDRGEYLGENQPGIITIESSSLCWGYYPELFLENTIFQTDDIGFLDEGGYLQIVGRNSQKIVTGGENVFPAEVEAAILATKLVTDVAVIGIPDPIWGEAITAVYVANKSGICSINIQQAIKDKISKFKQPKHWIKLNELPRNQLGKLNYKKLRQIITNL